MRSRIVALPGVAYFAQTPGVFVAVDQADGHASSLFAERVVVIRGDVDPADVAAAIDLYHRTRDPEAHL